MNLLCRFLWALLWPVRWYNALPKPPHIPLFPLIPRRDRPIETTPDRGPSTEPWND